MESKKDIGNYFKENLEQLDYSPSPKVWDGIEVELKKKKKRRFLFWMFFTVIAILGLSTYTYVNHSSFINPSKDGVITTDVNNRNSNSNGSNDNSDNVNSKNTDSNSINTDDSILNNTKENEIRRQNDLVNVEKTGKNSFVTNENSSSNSNFKKAGKKSKSTKSKPITSIGVADNTRSAGKNLSGKSKTTKSKNSAKFSKGENSAIAANKSGKYSKKTNKSGKSNSSNGVETGKSNNPDGLKTSKADALSSSEKEKSNSDGLKNTETNPVAASDKNKKLSLEELKKANQQKRDSLVAARKAEKEKKDLAQKPKEEEKDSTTTVDAKSGHEIVIAPYFGYNYNGNLGNGNFLNDSKTSKKGSQFQTSYGVLVRFMGSDKIGFQTGVGFINSTYSTTFEKTSDNFINPQIASLDIPISDINQLFPSDTTTTIVTATSKLSFIEVPIEGYYVFADRKFGFAAAFGISLMISQKKDFFLESDDIERFKAGELKNISPFSFTSNVKLNLFYKISEKLQFDLYPSIQYHIMGFKDVSNYHSYFFSIKTGLSYKL